MDFVVGDVVRQGFGFANPNHAAAAICAAFPFCWGWRGVWRWPGHLGDAGHLWSCRHVEMEGILWPSHSGDSWTYLVSYMQHAVKVMRTMG